jgi:hypothetical protein
MDMSREKVIVYVRRDQAGNTFYVAHSPCDCWMLCSGNQMGRCEDCHGKGYTRFGTRNRGWSCMNDWVAKLNSARKIECKNQSR